MRMLVVSIALVSLSSLLACGSKKSAPDAGSSATASSTNAASRAPTESAVASESSTPASSGSALPASSPPRVAEGCQEGMVRVEGDYCPAVTETCKKHHKEYDANKDDRNISERCLSYEQPSRCVSKKRKHLAFCVDRYEYPNKVGELPRVLTQWTEAKAICESEEKRLCTEQEFNFACEGPDMLPYVYGFERDTTAQTCNVDRSYRYPDHKHSMKTYEACQKDERCAAELQRLDQREPIGQRQTCVSWSGVHDLNGNVNEWVEIPKAKPPNRSGLKGGWWGPVRSRCRPTVGFHKESDYGYEVGFRCCADAK